MLENWQDWLHTVQKLLVINLPELLTPVYHYNFIGHTGYLISKWIFKTSVRISNYDIFKSWELAAWSQVSTICVLLLGFLFINVALTPQPLESISVWSLSCNLTRCLAMKWGTFLKLIAPNQPCLKEKKTLQKFGFPSKNLEFPEKIWIQKFSFNLQLWQHEK